MKLPEVIHVSFEEKKKSKGDEIFHFLFSLLSSPSCAIKTRLKQTACHLQKYLEDLEKDVISLAISDACQISSSNMEAKECLISRNKSQEVQIYEID